MVPRSGNNMAFKESGGKEHATDLDLCNENRQGAEESREQVCVGVRSMPTVMTGNAQTKYSNGGLHMVT